MKTTIAIILFVYSSFLYAVDLNLGVNFLKTDIPDDGVWHNDERKSDFDNTGLGWSIGGRLETPIDNLEFVAGWVDYGSFSSTALAISSDIVHEEWHQGLISQEEADRKTATWITDTKMKGPEFYLDYEFDINLGLFVIRNVFARFGYHFTKIEFKLFVPDWKPGIRGEGKPRPLRVHSKGDYEMGKIIGIGKRSGNYSIALELRTFDDKTRWQPPPEGDSVVFNITKRF